MTVRLFVDDDLEHRPTPAGWARACTVEQAKAQLERGDVTFASLDHDLGDPDGRDGSELVRWMCERSVWGRPVWPADGLDVHSGNPVGAEYMCKLIERYGPYRRIGSQRRLRRRPDAQGGLPAGA